MKIVQRSCDIWGGEEGLEEVRPEKAKKKERYKSDENLTRKSKVSCIAVVPFFYLYLAYSYAKKPSFP